MRCTGSWLSEIQNLIKKGKRDTVIEITPRMLKGGKREDFKKRLPSLCLSTNLKIRVLIVDLPTGEKEFLITSLLNREEFEYGIFKELYQLRWGCEENYKFHKVRIEIENFSGKSPNAVEQDFFATVFTGNIRALIANESQEELLQTFPKISLKHDYVINKSVSAGILKDAIVEALLNPNADLKMFCETLKKLMKKSTIPIRPGRRYERMRKANRKYPMNRRRSI